MKENVGKFFEIYASDPTVRSRVEGNVAAYPGSYEIREALTEFALLRSRRSWGSASRSRSCALMRRGSSLSVAWPRTANTTAASTAIGCLSAAGRSLGRKKKANKR